MKSNEVHPEKAEEGHPSPDIFPAPTWALCHLASMIEITAANGDSDFAEMNGPLT